MPADTSVLVPVLLAAVGPAAAVGLARLGAVASIYALRRLRGAVGEGPNVAAARQRSAEYAANRAAADAGAAHGGATAAYDAGYSGRSYSPQSRAEHRAYREGRSHGEADRA